MKSLQEFIENDLNINSSTSEYEGLVSSNQLNGLHELMNTCFVVSNPCKVDLPEIFPGNDHKRVIDHCIIHLLEKNLFDNILTFGYGIGRTEHVNNSLHCLYTNSNVSRIKNSQWHQLHKLMGTHNFVNLLINHTVLQFTGRFFTQIIGNRANRPHTSPPWYYQQNQRKELLHNKSSITLRTSLQKKFSIFKEPSMIPTESGIDALIDSIFQPFSNEIKDIRKSKIKPLFKRLCLNHTRVKYSGILDNICPIRKNSNRSHLNTQTPVNQVDRFIIILMEKLVPIKMFGSKRNKAKIFHFISILLRLPLGGNIPISEITTSLRIDDFTWLRTNRSAPLKTQDLVANFIFWFFQRFVVKIIATFFYSTEVSSNVEILFFRHDVWEAISKPFLKEYFERYLVENRACRNHKSYLLSKFNHSRLRLVPKKANGEFRVLAAPQKGADREESSAYFLHFKYVTYPVQCILDFIRKKRKTHFDKIYSQNEIVERIKTFKKALLKKYGFIPELSFIKFDIESCYDSIRRKKAMEVINRLLENESGFFVRSQSILNPSTGSLKIQNVVNGSRQPSDDEVYIDNVRTTYFTKQDVLEVLEMEFFKTALSFDGRCYLRKDGLFQGSRLSALVVDLAYDDLVESQNVFKPRPNHDSLVIRLADDFLMISSDKNQILSMERMSQIGFPEYGAMIKADKMSVAYNCSTNSTGGTLQFCALEISLNNLDTWKTSFLFNIPNFRFHSACKTYQKLRHLYELRLSYGTVDATVNEPLTVLYQIHQIGNNIATTFIQAFKGKFICLKEFEEFIYNILASSELAWRHCPEDVVFKSQVRLALLESFLEVLLKNASKFENAIGLLLFEVNKCLYISSLA
ncbi:hypothetical protein ZYGR_0AY02150 [Zygosaccharomyces rouxii]|uniref:Telomerase reverse transcriptase n=1 Tax=Zygosaccharomyces rouxii TaxID=4956 RepID=A0A1Q3AJR0_ZYGRO|nr:hypothetical protein ZYGR_0AY02150 [Zygosaccharomyces rouxii]